MKIDKHLTWVILHDEAQKVFLFGRKLRGFGEGKLVGIGGKVQDGESYEEAAIREVQEECGVKISSCEARGKIIFDNLEYEADEDGAVKSERVMMHLFVASAWEGEPAISDEIEPVWLAAKDLKYSEFWEDCVHWLPYVLADESVEAYFYYASSAVSKDGKQTIDHFDVDLVPNLLIAHIDDEDLGLERDEDTSDYAERLTTRAVLMNEEGQIALLREENVGCYTLPGGGIEGDELIREAMKREVQEETGYNCELLDELGYTIDERREAKKRSINYAYICRAAEYVGDNLTEGEKSDGYKLEWVDNIDEAIALFENLDLDSFSYRNRFKLVRDMHILMASAGLIRGKYGG